MEKAMDEDKDLEAPSEATDEHTLPIDRDPPPAIDWGYTPPAVEPAPRARGASTRMLIIVAVLSGLIGGAVGAYAVPRRSGSSVSVERISDSGSSVGQTTLTGVAAVARSVM